MKCALCGTESELDAAFVKERRSFPSRPRTLCPNCWVKRTNVRRFRTLAAFPVLGICGFVLSLVVPGSFVAAMLINFFLIGIFVTLSILPHELGHALVGKALGWRVHQIVVGIGKSLFKAKWAGIPFDFRSLPVAAVTRVAPVDTRWLRPKWFLIILAGPLVNAALALAVILACGGSLSHFDLDTLPNAARIFVWANICVFTVNLLPYQPKSGFGVLTDGGQLLQLLSFSKKSLDRLQALRFAFEAMASRERGDFAAARSWCDQGLALVPEDDRLLNLSGTTCLDEQKYEQARDLFLKLLAKEKHPQKRAIYLNNLAYADALSENPAWLAEADAYSRDALTMLPWLSSVVGTRGTVLVALGKYDEGLPLLRKSMEEAHLPRSKAENACHIAIALARTGKFDEAQKYLQLARQLDSKCPMLARAERALPPALPHLEGSVQQTQPTQNVA
jgi:Tfp pilus assembly protein PilF